MAAKEIRFTYDPSGTPANHDFYADRVVVEWEYDADEYTLLDDSVETDVRKVRPIFRVMGVFETTSSSTKTAGRLQLDFLKGTTTIRFFPDKSNTNVYSDVVPDISHRQTLMATRFGVVQKGEELRFKQSSWDNPTAAILDKFAQLTALL